MYVPIEGLGVFQLAILAYRSAFLVGKGHLSRPLKPAKRPTPWCFTGMSTSGVDTVGLGGSPLKDMVNSRI